MNRASIDRQILRGKGVVTTQNKLSPQPLVNFRYSDLHTVVAPGYHERDVCMSIVNNGQVSYSGTFWDNTGDPDDQRKSTKAMFQKSDRIFTGDFFY